MTTLTISAKGQVTLKECLLQHLGVGPGQKIEVEKLPEGRVVVKASRQKGAISDFIGCLSRKDARSLTTEEISDIAMQGWSEEN